MATQAERVTALEAQVEALRASLDVALKALAERVNEAHGRIDHAGTVFNDLRRALRPKTQPATEWIPATEFNAALAELRGNNPHSTERFPQAEIVARVMDRRVRMAQHA